MGQRLLPHVGLLPSVLLKEVVAGGGFSLEVPALLRDCEGFKGEARRLGSFLSNAGLLLTGGRSHWGRLQGEGLVWERR